MDGVSETETILQLKLLLSRIKKKNVHLYTLNHQFLVFDIAIKDLDDARLSARLGRGAAQNLT